MVASKTHALSREFGEGVMPLTVDASTDISFGRVNPKPAENPGAYERVLTDVDPIQEAHVAEPGQVVIDVAGLDADTVFAFQKAIARTWATAISESTFRDPGQPGVRLRLYADDLSHRTLSSLSEV
ncbi:uncharacterized protein SAZU_5665 [Streptomyces azureus]|uniref:Uncharacterized protein n=2 Tax=Streptomyces azureus TaxID=146537 RepID=A0A0K8PSI5_STRAJ|nr:uncharacterized protein SAZU_5665 [Streptomyces azureus]